MLDLARLGYHKLGQVSSYPTEGFEFFVTLGNDVSLPHTDRLAALLRIEDELSVLQTADDDEMLKPTWPGSRRNAGSCVTSSTPNVRRRGAPPRGYGERSAAHQREILVRDVELST